MLQLQLQMLWWLLETFVLYSHGATLGVPFSNSISLLKQISLPFFLDPHTFCPPPPFFNNFNPYSYHYNCLVPIQSLRDIFPYFIGFLSFLSWNSNYQGLRVLFNLFYAHLMQQS